MSGSSGEQHAVTPTVTTAPARSRWSKLPAHLGRARTSTLVLAVLFLAIGTLYLNIRPDTTGAATSAETGDQQPASTTSPAAPTTAETTTAPETTDSAPTTTEESRTSGPTSGTTDTSAPAEPTDTGAPTATLPEPSTTPTTVSPPG